MDRVVARIRKTALALADVDEGIACAGTALESNTFRVKKKAFVFVGRKDGGITIRLKLAASIPEAKKLADKSPSIYGVGAGGWVSAKLGASDPAPPRGVLERWIRESHALMSKP